MKTAKGNTFSAKEYLRKAGFSWDSNRKIWTAETVDMDYWTNKACNATYNGRKDARICSEIKIEDLK